MLKSWAFRIGCLIVLSSVCCAVYRPAIKWTKEPTLHPMRRHYCAISIEHEFIYQHIPHAHDHDVFVTLLLVLCQPDKNVTQKYSIDELLCSPEQERTLAVYYDSERCESMVNEYPWFFRFTFIKHPLSRSVHAWKSAKTEQANFNMFPTFKQWIASHNLTDTLVQVTSEDFRQHLHNQSHYILGHNREPSVHFVAKYEDYWNSWHFIFLRVRTLPLKRFTEVIEHKRLKLISIRKKKKGVLAEINEMADEAWVHYTHDYALFHYPKHITKELII